MKINELVEGKVYKCDKSNSRYKLIDEMLFVERLCSWEESGIRYNDVLRMNFEEVVLIPDENTPMNTRVRVRDKKDDEWEDKYFCCYLPSASEKFACFSEGENQKYAETVATWKYCEIIEESEVVE